jgi:hypothetical protein
VNTITPHLAVATVLAARHLSSWRPSAIAPKATLAAGGTSIAVVFLVVAFLALMASAARGLAAVLAEFLRVAAAMTSFLFTVAMAVAVAVVLLLHH